MMLKIINLNDDKFIEEFLPKVIMIKIYQKLETINTSNMNSYLKKLFQKDITVEDIISQIKFSYNKLGKERKLYVNKNIYEETTHQKLIALLKLLDYGALGVRGLDIIDSSFKYVEDNLVEIYYSYRLVGGN